MAWHGEPQWACDAPARCFLGLPLSRRSCQPGCAGSSSTAVPMACSRAHTGQSPCIGTGFVGGMGSRWLKMGYPESGGKVVATRSLVHRSVIA